MFVKTSAPTRIDIAGGTLDLWPIHQVLAKKATLNIAIDLYSSVEIRLRDDQTFVLQSTDLDIKSSGSFAEVCSAGTLPLLEKCLEAVWSFELPPIEVKCSALSPAGAGLGGSSSLAISILAALSAAKAKVNKEEYTLKEYELVDLAKDVEANLIHSPTGCQDYWAAVEGGCNLLKFPPGKVLIEQIPSQHIQKIAEYMIVCFSGQSRKSAINNWEVYKKVFDGDRELIAALEKIGGLTELCGEAAKAGDVGKLLEISKEEWQQRLKLWPNISTPVTQVIDRTCTAAGARFSRVCGAGGGGVMAIFCDPMHRQKVEKAAIKAGGVILETQISKSGLVVES